MICAGLKEVGSVLINGGAASVGRFPVQMPKALGATVAATCDPSNVGFVESLGPTR